MKKLMEFAAVTALVLCCGAVGMLIAQKETLRTDLIRLHVVAASDSADDQSTKLLVRDAIIQYLQPQLEQLPDAQAAKVYLGDNLAQLETVANQTLREAGSWDTAKVTLCEEEFPVRHYDTFSLPSGVYESLRVTIGPGEGQNWWCVVFPSLCVNAAAESFAHTAAGAGFSDELSHTLAGDDGYEISFFFLDCLGRLENLFHFG
ncbi:MAG: stage II sporulation protein R [Oscillospiraceae bacterium]|nr:stage II sporulation protein R [Oscillospiraceae bacterium]